MQKENPKTLLYEQLARVGKALSNANRLQILEYLAQGEKSVDKLAKIAGLSLANTSQHLQSLWHAGLVASRKEGKNVYYRLSDDEVVDLSNLLRRIAERNIAEVDRLINAFLKTRDDMEPVPAAELLERAKKGEVTVLDVRPPEEFGVGHIPGAINVPYKKLEEYINNLDSSKEVVAYCRGAYCLLSFDAVARLREKGFTAKRLEDGFPEWKRAGLPVDKN